MDRFEAMSMLMEVVRCGSLSAAGRALGVPIPTLSRKIADLETLLGAQLLMRTTRSLTLTEAGTIYVAAARRILEQIEEAEREAAGEFVEPKGELVVTAPIMFGRVHVLPIVAEFLTLFPKIDVRLLLADANLHLVDDRVDMAIRIGELADSAMIATRIGSMRTVVCGSPCLFDLNGKPQTPAEVEKLPCIAVTTLTPLPKWRFEGTGSSRLMMVAIAPRLLVTTNEAAVEAAVRSVGLIQLLHYQVADAVTTGKLQIILEDFEPSRLPVHLLHAARGQLPVKIRRFLDFAAPKLRERLSALSEAAIIDSVAPPPPS